MQDDLALCLETARADGILYIDVNALSAPPDGRKYFLDNPGYQIGTVTLPAYGSRRSSRSDACSFSICCLTRLIRSGVGGWVRKYDSMPPPPLSPLACSISKNRPSPFGSYPARTKYLTARLSASFSSSRLYPSMTRLAATFASP